MSIRIRTTLFLVHTLAFFCSPKSTTGTVHIVGNGLRVLNRKAGREIDEGSEVVRLNSFDISSRFAPFVGTRIDRWVFTPATHSPKPRKAISTAEVRELYTPSNMRGWASARLRSGLLTPEMKYQIFTKTPSVRTLQMILFAGTGFRPSTGCLVVLRAVAQNLGKSRVVIHGFDGYQDSKVRLSHYDGRDFARDGSHNFGYERNILNTLQEAGLIEIR